MLLHNLNKLFIRDLNRVKNEIEAYQEESNLWLIDQAIKNSGGNLCLHLIGNLNTFIGVGLSKTDYIRKRDLEFSSKGIPRAELIAQLEETMVVVEASLTNLSPDQLSANFPIEIWDKPTEMEFTLLHLLTHLNYHLGQINYHRRMLDKFPH